MPPTRTIPPAKVVKTERTHEENQERAYIAASRRSDRSLEARVESARRASEIHKRRTGRGLRVTEQDVLNEEMYEEEDDDMPLHYRRLTAHLQTSNPGFNNRLSAYLTTHVGMRDLLQQTINESYNQQQQQQQQQQNIMAQFPHQPMPFVSPMAGYIQQPMMQPPQSPNTYRQAPYPPRPQAIQQAQHHRSASIATPQEMTGSSISSPVIKTENDRRMSMPAVPATTTNSPIQVRTPLSATSTTPKPPQPQRTPSFPPGTFTTPFLQQHQKPILSQPYDINVTSNMQEPYFPFTTNLGGDAQSLLAFTNSFPGNLLDGSGVLPGQFINFNENEQLPSTFNDSKQQAQAVYGGLTSTLAPSVTDMSTLNAEFGINPNQSTYFQDAFKAGSSGITPVGTPGVNDSAWTSFFDADAWEHPASQT
jgi:hypothetical protein